MSGEFIDSEMKLNVDIKEFMLTHRNLESALYELNSQEQELISRLQDMFHQARLHLHEKLI